MRIRVSKNHRFTLVAFLLAAGFLAIAAVRGLLPVVEANSGGGATMHALTLQFEGSGEVHLDPHDETFSSDTTRSYLEDTDVTMTATPDSGWYFDHWEGNVTGTGAVRTVQMSGPKIALAVFKQPSLTVHKQGSGQVQIYVQGSPPGETLTPSFTRTYPYGTQVVLVAIPPTGWGFKEWTGDMGGTSPTKTIGMSESKTVTAVFEPLKITINKEGEGLVGVSPPGITDEPTFTVDLSTAAGGSAELTLTAIPAQGWSFKEWTGDYSGENNPATVTVYGDESVTAVFEEIELTVDIDGRGLVHIDPPDITPLEEEYPHTETYSSSSPQSPQEVELTASPINEYWGFKEWTGNLGLDPQTPTDTLTITIEMDEARSATAVFEQVELTTNVQGEGSVSTNPAGEVISPTTRGFAYGTIVELTATPSPGWAFKEWQGGLSGYAATISTPALQSDLSVTAVFEQIELTADIQGRGAIHIDPPDVTPEEEEYPHTEVYPASTPASPQTVTLTAVEAANWGLKEWTGDLEPGTQTDASSIEIEMDAPKSVTAVFEQAVLTTSVEGEGTVGATPDGEVLSADTRGYRPGATVTLEATPAPGWGFKEWTGDLTSTDNPAEIVMDGDQSVTAVFYQVTLTVTGTGEGKVAANPYGGDPQTPTFTADYEPDGQVTLTAHPEPGWGFKRWTGDASGTSATVTITMDGDKTVNAEFYQTTLTVTKTGEGQVTATPYGATQTPTFTEDYEPGQQVTLTAVPAQGWAFKEWMGGASGLSVSISVTMDGDKSVTAVFEQIQLTVNMQGQGTVSPPGGGETLPHTITYASAQNVNLTASPAPGWGFKQWTGDAGGTSPSTSVYVDGEKGVTAVFKEQHTLTTAQQGQGTVDPATGATHIYLHGDTASVSATAAQGWEFDHWSGLSETAYPNGPAGPGTSSANPLSLAMINDEAITAVFHAECELILPSSYFTVATPTIVNSAKEQLESWLSVPFGDVDLTISGTYTKKDGTCRELDGSIYTAEEYTGAATIGLGISDVPWPGLGWVFDKEIQFGETQGAVHFVAGVTGSVSGQLSGNYYRVDHFCPCLEPNPCSEQASMYLSGNVSASASVSLELSAQATMWPFGSIDVNLCDLTLVEVGVSGGIQIGLESEDCESETSICGGLSFGPITISSRVSGLGMCVEFSESWPSSPWFFGDPCTAGG